MKKENKKEESSFYVKENKERKEDEEKEENKEFSSFTVGSEKEFILFEMTAKKELAIANVSELIKITSGYIDFSEYHIFPSMSINNDTMNEQIPFIGKVSIFFLARSINGYYSVYADRNYFITGNMYKVSELIRVNNYYLNSDLIDRSFSFSYNNINYSLFYKLFSQTQLNNFVIKVKENEKYIRMLLL